jgi:hypothetical protein
MCCSMLHTLHGYFGAGWQEGETAAGVPSLAEPSEIPKYSQLRLIHADSPLELCNALQAASVLQQAASSDQVHTEGSARLPTFIFIAV